MESIRRILRTGGNSGQEESRPQSARAEALIQEFESSEKGWFWETDREGNLSYVSESVARALGREAPDLLQRPFTDIISSESAEGNSTSERTLGFYLSSHVAFSDLIVRAKTKNEIWWSISGRPVHDDIGRFFGFRGFASDLTKMRQSEVELDRLARQDSLTGLPNREVLRRALDDALISAVRRKHRCSVFLLDLDRFKAVNDTLGHPAGDTLLRLVSLRLREVIGDMGQVGRLGGDEFEVVLPATSDKDTLSKLAQGIIDSLSRPYTINGTVVSIGASVGIVTSDYDDRTSDDLMRDADLALYAAKAAGKGCFRFFAPEMHEAARDRQLMESDLRVALEKGQLRLAYQPCVDSSSEAVTGFEALIRWDHPEHGPVSPVQFIPLAEEIGLINEIGEWVLRTACAEAANWPAHISVAVNLSPVQFKSHERRLGPILALGKRDSLAGLEVEVPPTTANPGCRRQLRLQGRHRIHQAAKLLRLRIRARPDKQWKVRHLVDRDAIQDHAVGIDERELSLVLPQRGRRPLDDIDHQCVRKPPRNPGVLDPAVTEKAIADLRNVDQRLRSLGRTALVRGAAQFVGDDGIDETAVHVVDAGNLVAADPEARFANRRSGRPFGFGRDVQGDRHDQPDGENERAEHKASNLVRSRLIDRKTLGYPLWHRNLGRFLRLRAARAAPAYVSHAHCSASAIRPSTSSP